MKTKVAAALLVVLPLGPAFAEEAPEVSTLDTPRAGWRDSGDERRSFVQPVHYPASSVNTEGAAEASLISGHIAAAHKGPATLVVNGVALPLQVGEGGAFARPCRHGAARQDLEDPGRLSGRHLG